jgi:hypothetical protein
MEVKKEKAEISASEGGKTMEEQAIQPFRTP